MQLEMNSPPRKRSRISQPGQYEDCVFCFKSKKEELLRCGDCWKQMHLSCQGLPHCMLEIIRTYHWQCGTCKQCLICYGKGNEESMLLCDHCDRGYHSYCLHCKEDTRENEEGDWICPVCKVPEPSPSTSAAVTGEPVDTLHERAKHDTSPSNHTSKRTAQFDPDQELKEDREGNVSPTKIPVQRTVTRTSSRNSNRQLFYTPSKNAKTKDVHLPDTQETVDEFVKDEIKNEDRQQVTYSADEKKSQIDAKEAAQQVASPSCQKTVRSKRTSNKTPEKETLEQLSMSYPQRRFSSRLNRLTSEDNDTNLSFQHVEEAKSSSVDEDIVFKTETESSEPSESQSSDSRKRKRGRNFGYQATRSSQRSASYTETSQYESTTSTDLESDANVSIEIGLWADNEVCITSEVTNSSPKKQSHLGGMSATDSEGSSPTRLRRKSDNNQTSKCLTRGCDGSGSQLHCSAHHTAMGFQRKEKGSRTKRNSTQEMNSESEKQQIKMIQDVEDGMIKDWSPKQESLIDKTRKCYPKRERRCVPEVALYGSTLECAGALINTLTIESVQPKVNEVPAEVDEKKAIASSMKSPVRSKLKENKHVTSPQKPKTAVTVNLKKVTPQQTNPKKAKTPVKSKKQTPVKLQTSSSTKSRASTPIKAKKESINKVKKGTPGKGSQVKSKSSKPQQIRRAKESKCDKKQIGKQNPKFKREHPDEPVDARDKGGARTPASSKASSVATIDKTDASDVDIRDIITADDISLFEGARRKALENLEPETDELSDSCIQTIDFGPYEIDTWYVSPYPREYSKLRKLYVCEFCLKYMKSSTILRRHMAKCVIQHPPGDEIYRQGQISVFEVDGEKSKTYCQNLCLLAKLFLDHKTLYYEVGPFLFYIMTEADDKGCHVIGYFSKEKSSFLNYNVACILVLPHYMKKGYGRMLIDLSYLLSQRENKIGTPEHPLSDLGLISYRKYWTDVVLRYLADYHDDTISIKEISQKTSIHPNDIVSTLQSLGMVKYWKGKHLILSKKELIDEHKKKWEKRKSFNVELRPEGLHWIPKNFVQDKGKTQSK